MLFRDIIQDMKTKASTVKWRMKNYDNYKKKAREHGRQYYYRIRDELHLLLGDKCIKCGFTDRRALQIDHVNGGGNSRKLKNRSGQGKFRQVLQEVRSGSKEFQLLCSNCNMIKRTENEELRGHLIKSREDYIKGMVRKGYPKIP